MKHYLFFDTETTGLPLDFDLPRHIVENWPRLVQLSWLVTDDQGNRLKTADYIVKPDGFTIPTEASNLHGITTQMALQKGNDLAEVLAEFLNDFKDADLIVGHNVEFDKNIVGAEMIRMGMRDIMDSKPAICTMKSSTAYCAIPNRKRDGYKYPNLKELHMFLFGKPFEDAHNSASDIAATERCFWKLQKRGVIRLP